MSMKCMHEPAEDLDLFGCELKAPLCLQICWSSPVHAVAVAVHLSLLRVAGLHALTC